jgi:hypothetical protein
MDKETDRQIGQKGPLKHCQKLPRQGPGLASTVGEALDYGGKFEGINLSALWHREKVV